VCVRMYVYLRSINAEHYEMGVLQLSRYYGYDLQLEADISGIECAKWAALGLMLLLNSYIYKHDMSSLRSTAND